MQGGKKTVELRNDSMVRSPGFLLPHISLIAAGEASKQEMLMGTDN